MSEQHADPSTSPDLEPDAGEPTGAVAPVAPVAPVADPVDPDVPLDLDALARRVDLPDEEQRERARELLAGLDLAPGALGGFGRTATWFAGLTGAAPAQPFARPRLVVVAADHGVAAAGVSAQAGALRTRELVRRLRSGGGSAGLLADRAGVGLRVLDVGVASPDDDLLPGTSSTRGLRTGSGRIDREDALTADEVLAAVRAGRLAADREVDEGADLLLLGGVGAGSSTPAAAVAGLLGVQEVALVVGRGSGIDDVAWMAKAAAVRDALRRMRPAVSDPLRVLAIGGGADLAAMSGFLVQAALRRTPVVVDGVVAAVAALVAQRMVFRAPRWWVAASRSPEPAHRLVLSQLDLPVVLEHELAVGDGTGALLALPVLTSAMALVAGLPAREG